MPTRNLRSPPRSVKAFPMPPLSFSTRSKEAACCPNRRPTSTHGSMESADQDFAQASIVLELELGRKREKVLSLPKTYARVREIETLPTGSRMTHVRRRRA